MADIEQHCSHSTEDRKLFDCIERQRGEFSFLLFATQEQV